MRRVLDKSSIDPCDPVGAAEVLYEAVLPDIVLAVNQVPDLLKRQAMLSAFISCYFGAVEAGVGRERAQVVLEHSYACIRQAFQSLPTAVGRAH